MKFFFITLLFIVYPDLSFGQNDEQFKIMTSLINFIKPNDCTSDVFYIREENFKTYFSAEEFTEETKIADSLPKNIIVELENFKSNNIFDYQLLKGIKGEYSIKLYKKNEVRPKGLVLSFSNPIFDKKKEHCVITVVKSFRRGSFIANDYFLVKIYGEWLVIETFKYIIS